MQLPEYVQQGESQTLEFKRNFNEEVLETISAFANTDGGVILIGVDDDGSLPGIDVGKKTLEDFANRIQVAIDPRVQPSLKVIAVTPKTKHIVELKIQPSTGPAISANGRFFKRVGKTNQRIGSEEIAQRIMASLKLSWDSGIEADCGLEELDSDAIERFTELIKQANRRPVPDDTNSYVMLEKLQLTNNKQPTRAAVLLFGKRPQRFFQSAFVKVGRFKTETNIVDDKEMHGGLISQVEEAMAWLRNSLTAEVIVSDKAAREMSWEYPLDAVREAIANAVCHRTYDSDAHVQIRLYDNRLEFWNPGNLPAGISVEDLLQEHESHPRNKGIAEAFFLCGFIERWGTGTLRMADSLKGTGHPAPEFDNSHSSRFRVVFRKEYSEAMLRSMNFNDRQVAAVLHVKAGNTFSNQEYQSMFGISKRTATRELAELVEKRIFDRQGKTGKGTFYRLR